MNAEAHAALEAAKVRLSEAIAAREDAAIRASADLLDAQACDGKVVAVGQARTAAVVSARANDVLRLGDERRAAEVDAEIAASRAAASAAKHAAAVDAMRNAEAAVTEAAQSALDAEMIELAGKFDTALDAALDIGKQLQARATRDGLNTPMHELSRAMVLPPEVTKALARMPTPNPYDVPISILQNGNAGTDARALRLAALIER